jgi:hypothetical protein
MKYIKVAPLAGVIAYVAIALWPREGWAEPDTVVIPQDTQDSAEIPSEPTLTDTVVGEYNLVTGPDIFLPHQTCRVSTSKDVLKLLQECKNQRKGWLRL